MVEKFGISLDDDVAEAVEKPLEYGDKRSNRIQHLIQAGLAVEAAFESEGYDLDISRVRETRSFVRQVFREYED